jgi:hypothetical protein
MTSEAARARRMAPVDEQLAVLIYNGLPLQAGMAEPWRRVS